MNHSMLGYVRSSIRNVSVGFCSLLISFLSPSAQAAPPSTYAVWVYTDVARQLDSRATFFNFAASHQINQVYLSSGNLLRTNQAALASFIAEAKGKNIAVTLLLGEYDWALTANHSRATELVTIAKQFTSGLTAAKKAAPIGIQLDVEPYALPAWDNNMQSTANQFLDMLKKVRKITKGTLPLSVATPFWYDNRIIARNGQSRPLSEWTIDATDATVMMDYRNTASRIISGANTEMAYASTRGKPLTVGVNVKCSSAAGYAETTFCDAGESAMMSAVSEAETALSPYQSFGGFAVFSYEAWLILNP